MSHYFFKYFFVVLIKIKIRTTKRNQPMKKTLKIFAGIAIAFTISSCAVQECERQNAGRAHNGLLCFMEAWSQ